EAPRNTTLWQPHSQLLHIAGFGSLQGDIDIWDTKELKRIGRCNAHGSKYCAWAPNGKCFLTAVISSGLRVDNGFRIWRHDGSLLFSKQLPQLDGIAWRPVLWGQYPPPALDFLHKTEEELEIQASSTRSTSSGAPASTGKYRHPNASKATIPSVSLRNPTSVVTKYMPPQRAHPSPLPGDTAAIPSRVAPSAASRIPGDTGPAPRASLNAAGRAAGAARSPARGAPASPGGPKSPAARPAAQPASPKTVAAASGSPVPEDPVEALQKRRRALIKKLRQIDLLKDQRTQGKTLLPAQLSKISSQTDIQQQIDEIDSQLAALGAKTSQ
ncbi:MAG: hypothetical protein Q8P67_00425, partial [archaeon]|nr:hypothetical protein [archaeon]